MSYKAIRTWSWPCPDCRSIRQMGEFEHDLGGRIIVNTRWCACDIGMLYGSVVRVGPVLLEADADPAKGRTVELDVQDRVDPNPGKRRLE